MNNTAEIIAPIILYGLVWGAYYFWGYDKDRRRVLANPEKYSKFTVTFHRKLTLFLKLLVSLVTALLIFLFVIAIVNVLSYVWGLFQ